MGKIPVGTRPVVDHVSARERSGLTVKEYCRKAGIAEHTYYYWRTRGVAGSSGSLPMAPSLGFIEVGTRSSVGSGYVLRFHRSGVDLLVNHGFDTTELSELAKVAATLEIGGEGC